MRKKAAAAQGAQEQQKNLPARVRFILNELTRCYPRAECGLNYRNPLELLVATILSAQCTDVRVNKVTPALFALFPDARALAAADLEELEAAIRSTGFFRHKAKNIQECCRQLVEKHDGRVPGSLEELVALPGIGRKTANVILGEVFNVPGVVVDTHVKRLSRHLGLTRHQDPVKIERDLMAILPRENWTIFSHLLIHHGRQVCIARRPRCQECGLRSVCELGAREETAENDG